jgi:predicted O-methyltransferase YrrM
MEMGLGIKLNKVEHFYQKIDGFSNEENQLELLKTILPFFKEKIIIAEIGVYKGRGTAMWNVHLINEKIPYDYYAIDHFLGSDEHQKDVDYFNITKENLKSIINNINLIKKSSIESCVEFKNEFFDVIYIDASHDYESVKTDILSWLPKLKKNGIICGDDYISGWPGVIMAVDEIFGKEKINTIGSQQWWIKNN